MTTVAHVGVLGRGKAGLSLARSLRAANLDVVTASRAELDALMLQPFDALFLAVPDDAIAEVAQSLVGRTDALVVHLSGARDLSVLRPLARAGAFHPLAALNPLHPIPAGALIAIDALADDDVTALHETALAIGASPVRVPAAQRTRYHAGAVVSANLAVALVAAGQALLVEAGVPADLARAGLARLLASTAHGALERPLPDALTGPIARGDVHTVEGHLALLDVDDPSLASLYRALSLRLVELARLDDDVKARLRAALAASAPPSL